MQLSGVSHTPLLRNRPTQRFTWLVAIATLSLTAPLLAQAQPVLSPDATTFARTADASQRDLRWGSALRTQHWFVHPGAHAAGVNFVLNAANDPGSNRLRQRFDIISLDPRGAGRTRPLTCGFNLPPPLIVRGGPCRCAAT
jgi:hypothetical protein